MQNVRYRLTLNRWRSAVALLLFVVAAAAFAPSVASADSPADSSSVTTSPCEGLHPMIVTANATSFNESQHIRLTKSAASGDCSLTIEVTPSRSGTATSVFAAGESCVITATPTAEPLGATVVLARSGACERVEVAAQVDLDLNGAASEPDRASVSGSQGRPITRVTNAHVEARGTDTAEATMFCQRVVATWSHTLSTANEPTADVQRCHNGNWEITRASPTFIEWYITGQEWSVNATTRWHSDGWAILNDPRTVGILPAVDTWSGGSVRARAGGRFSCVYHPGTWRGTRIGLYGLVGPGLHHEFSCRGGRPTSSCLNIIDRIIG